MIFCAAPWRASIGVNASARTYTSGDGGDRDAERADRAASGPAGGRLIRRSFVESNGKASVHAVTNTMSNATRMRSQGHASATGRPAMSRADDCAAAITIGTKKGRLSIGSSSSAMRVFTAIALNSVPTATSPIAASARSRPARRCPRPSGRL